MEVSPIYSPLMLRGDEGGLSLKLSGEGEDHDE
jgi:hypothetical protein